MEEQPQVEIPILAEEVDPKGYSETKKESKMEHIVTMPAQNNDAALVAALTNNRGNNDGLFGGGGAMGGLIAGALLSGNGGLFGGNRGAVGEGVVTPAQLNSALAGVTSGQNTNAILDKLGTIEAAIPYNEAQMQLALAGSTASLTNGITQTQLSQLNSAAGINKNISDAIATSLASQGNIKETVLQGNFALAQIVNNDGDKTRALITSQYESNLQRELAVAQAALAEQRAAGRIREVEVNVTNNATAIATQSQAQNQAQQQLQLMIQQNALLANLANDIQVVRQGQTIFNSGTMAASGTQAAANTRVN